ncbi:MAG: hypothetical protein LLG08_01845 [Actinomycetia bacterium]|nr:hypothetical protein [Actinomycetes bacterium]
MDFEQTRQDYRPQKVTALFVGESPPASEKFFYLGNSNLARFTFKAFRGRRPESDAEMLGFLRDFQARGFYLVDLCLEPVNGLKRPARHAARRRGIEGLAATIARVRPRSLVVVMKGIKPEVVRAVEIASDPGLSVHVLPFPASGHQVEYVEELRALLPALSSCARSEVTGA